MQVFCDMKILESNRDRIKKIAEEKDIDVAFMIKHQLLQWGIITILKDEKIYTTADKVGVNIYDDENIVIVDAFEKREGITLEEAGDVENKHTAIVNFYCCEQTKPIEKDLWEITLKLRNMGYKIVSLGGSMIMNYYCQVYDELRVGEAFLTGYSTVDNQYFKGLENPFSIEVDIFKEDGDRTIIKHGFLEIGGFTDVDTICVNTDFTVLKFARDNYIGDTRIRLKPDYYTLIKLAHNGELKNVKNI